MARPSLAEKDILNPFEAIDYFVLSRRKFYDLLKIPLVSGTVKGSITFSGNYS